MYGTTDERDHFNFSIFVNVREAASTLRIIARCAPGRHLPFWHITGPALPLPQRQVAREEAGRLAFAPVDHHLTVLSVIDFG